VLDLVVQPDRSVARKDEDELSAAVRSGRFSASEAAAIEGDAATVEDVVRRWESPFCDGWESWAPDATWPLPELPPAYVDRASFRS
jgi:predicted RNA-binding protein associated with RNAse of E/G family